MQKNGAEQPKVYRHIRTMLKIRSTPTEGKQIAEESQTAEPLCTDCTTLENAKFKIFSVTIKVVDYC